MATAAWTPALNIAPPISGGSSNPFVILGQAPPPQAKRKSLIPNIPLQSGEQYRFHFKMSKCIGCKCCEVACSEQNNLPPEISWRRVGEVEGGSYPNTMRLHMSMGCNHCLEPACMNGCPTGAYIKDSTTGLVLHSAETCIGCEYCVWNCPYGVPAFNEERGVVGKCDMCSGRILQGLEPACVEACPEEALGIEIVNIERWRNEYRETADAPGLPSSEDTISTTRITLPTNLPADLQKADYYRVRPEKPHYSLVGMTVMTQLSVGAFSLVWLAGLLFGVKNFDFAAYASLAVGLTALAAAPLHLGRPLFAYRAMKMWRRSWLSREVVLLTGFGLLASVYSIGVWTGTPGTTWVGALSSVLGLFGIIASSCIYLVPARPSWNSKYTTAEFILTALLLGALFTLAAGESLRFLLYTAVAAAVGQMMIQMLRFLWLSSSDDFELKASARLLGVELRSCYIARLALLIAGGVIAPLASHPVPGLLLALLGELVGRYLFFRSVVPRNMAMSYFTAHQEAA